ncbi:MAG: hypothetical protein KAW12_18170 [Candidatus Aminicenantes bacterium]|nr:hypothetical protein [Candidatus Aminicenantes bacterium]
MENEKLKMEEIVANLVQKVERRFYGKYRGFVVDNNDPEQMGRLKVMVPSVLGNDVVTGWAYPCVPYGGAANQGMLFIPEPNAAVWIEFEEGDLEFPIWIGTIWSKPEGESELPKPNKPDGVEEEAVQAPPTCKIIKTLKGHTIQLEDADGKEMVTIVEAKNKHVVTMNQDGIKITDGANKHVVTLYNEGIQISDGVNKHDTAWNKDGIKVTDGVNKHEIIMNADGIKVTDKKGNFIEMKEDSFTITSKVPFKIDASGQAVEIIGTTIDLNKG